jgi:hypothetical protein
MTKKEMLKDKSLLKKVAGIKNTKGVQESVACGKAADSGPMKINIDAAAGKRYYGN